MGKTWEGLPSGLYNYELQKFEWKKKNIFKCY